MSCSWGTSCRGRYILGRHDRLPPYWHVSMEIVQPISTRVLSRARGLSTHLTAVDLRNPRSGIKSRCARWVQTQSWIDRTRYRRLPLLRSLPFTLCRSADSTLPRNLWEEWAPANSHLQSFSPGKILASCGKNKQMENNFTTVIFFQEPGPRSILRQYDSWLVDIITSFNLSLSLVIMFP